MSFDMATSRCCAPPDGSKARGRTASRWRWPTAAPRWCAASLTEAGATSSTTHSVRIDESASGSTGRGREKPHGQVRGCGAGGAEDTSAGQTPAARRGVPGQAREALCEPGRQAGPREGGRREGSPEGAEGSCRTAEFDFPSEGRRAASASILRSREDGDRRVSRLHRAEGGGGGRGRGSNGPIASRRGRTDQTGVPSLQPPG